MGCLFVSWFIKPSLLRLTPTIRANASSSRNSLSYDAKKKSSTSRDLALSTEEAQFVQASKSYNIIPLHRCIYSDQLTPVLAYRCLVEEGDWDCPSFLFDSLGSSGSSMGRYSVLGDRPAMEIIAKEKNVTVMDYESGLCTTEKNAVDPLLVPQRIMKTWNAQAIPQLSDIFCGGWVGYFSYDWRNYSAEKKLTLSGTSEDDENLPKMYLGLFEDVIVLDRVEKKAYVIHWVRLDHYSSVQDAYKEGMKQLNSFVSKVQNINSPKLPSGYVKLYNGTYDSSLNMLSMTKEAYNKVLSQAKEHIHAKDIFHRGTFADPFEVYRSLRVVTQSPYMTYLQARRCILLASTSEILTCAKKVTGELLDHLSCWDALRTALQLETVKSIDQLESIEKGPNCGIFGGISFSGNMDIAIALQNIVFPTGNSYKDKNNCNKWIAHLQSGANIIDRHSRGAQSEYEDNAAALIQAINLAESTFQKN